MYLFFNFSLTLNNSSLNLVTTKCVILNKEYVYVTVPKKKQNKNKAMRLI